MRRSLLVPKKMLNEMFNNTAKYWHRPHFERRWVDMKPISSFQRGFWGRGNSYIVVPASELLWNRPPLRKKK